jgi:hypothetical protein
MQMTGLNKEFYDELMAVIVKHKGKCGKRCHTVTNLVSGKPAATQAENISIQALRSKVFDLINYVS